MKCLALALVASLVVVSTAHAAPLIISPRSLALLQAPDRSAEARQLRADAHSWKLWGAITMAGGVLDEVLGRTAMATETSFCSVGYSSVLCTTNKDPNMTMVYLGAALVGAGTLEMIYGEMQDARARQLAPDVMIGPHRLGVLKRIRF